MNESIKKCLSDLRLDLHEKNSMGSFPLDFDHLILRLTKCAEAENKTAYYIEALREFSEIPGFAVSDRYRSFYELMCTYNVCQTRVNVMSEYLDEFIGGTRELFEYQKTTTKWKKTQ